MRIGTTRSVSFEIAIAASNRPFHASFDRWAARFTPEPRSFMVWNPAITASEIGTPAGRPAPTRHPRPSGQAPTDNVHARSAGTGWLPSGSATGACVTIPLPSTGRLADGRQAVLARKRPQ